MQFSGNITGKKQKTFVSFLNAMNYFDSVVRFRVFEAVKFCNVSNFKVPDMTQFQTRNGKHARSIFRLKFITTPWVSCKPKQEKSID